MILLPYLEHLPRIGAGVAAHPSTAVIGRVDLGPDCSLGPLVLVRGDGNDVRIGAACWFGEASTVHIASVIYSTTVGAHVTVGRYGLVHACTIGDDCVIGEHAAVMDAAVVGAGAVIAAESVVPPGKILEGGWLYAGAPARPIEPVSSKLIDELHRAMRASPGEAAPHVIAAARVPHLRHAPGSGVSQAFADGVYVAPNASIVGRVALAPRSSVWFGVEIDAGQASVDIGEQTNIQDNSRLYAGKPGEDIRIGPRVVVGHNARIFASTIEEDAIIGMGAIISNATIVRAGACVAAGSVTEPGMVVTSGQVWSGRPARAARALSERNREAFAEAVLEYVEYARIYLAAAARLPS